MHLQPDDEQSAVTEVARALGIDVLSPAARAAERSGTVPDAVWATVLASGLALPVPESDGGGGVPGAVTQQYAAEGLAYGDAAIALAAQWSGAAAGLIATHGTASQREGLPEFTRDVSRRGAVALYEGFGRGVSDYATTIELARDRVRVRGTKVGVASAVVADPLVVVGRDPSTGQLRAVLTRGSEPGVVVDPSATYLGLDAARLTSVTVDLDLPIDLLLGGPEIDPAALTSSVQRLRLLPASAMLGTAQRATEYAARYATERMAFGRPIAGFQGVSFPIAESLMAIESARLHVAELAARLEDGSLDGGSADDAVAEAIGYASTAAVEATRRGVQLLGGHGYVEDHPVELWFREASMLATLDCDPTWVPFQPAV